MVQLSAFFFENNAASCLMILTWSMKPSKMTDFAEDLSSFKTFFMLFSNLTRKKSRVVELFSARANTGRNKEDLS